MKTRQGFVSNSSSTSFIIASKVPLTKKILEEKLGLKVSDNFLLKNVADGIVKFFLESGSEYLDDLEEMIEEYEYEDSDYSPSEYDKERAALYRAILEKHDKGWDVRYGCASNDRYDEEELIVYNLRSLRIEDDDFIFVKAEC